MRKATHYDPDEPDVKELKTILVAPDSFKGSLSAFEAADAIERGIKDISPNMSVVKHPISDGGEGMTEVMTPLLQGSWITTEVSGPLPGQRVKARWSLSGDRKTAIIEMAEAAGLYLIPESRRDPKITTTYGVGEMIRAALQANVNSIVIGIGGSGTSDGGAGMAQALGVRFLDSDGKSLKRGGIHLENLSRIEMRDLDKRLDKVKFLVACDVQNVLCGDRGASKVFGPQKGATREDVDTLDRALGHYANVVQKALGVELLSIRGGGAAGGLGVGLVAFCGAKIRRGIDVVLNATGFDRFLQGADLVITGEGKIDSQLRFGKALSGVLERARQFRIPAVAVVGNIDGRREEFVNKRLFIDLEQLVDDQTPLEVAIKEARSVLQARTSRLLKRLVS